MQKNPVRFIVFVICVLLCFTMCGCNVFTVDTEELLVPPSLTGDMKPIEKAIKATAPKGYLLKYPSAGQRRSAVTFEDIDSDGVQEAFAFFSTDDGEDVKMNLQLLRKSGKVWKSKDVTSIVASGVESIVFSDLDGDGKSEVIVGWEIYGSTEKKVGVYSVKKGKFSECFLQPYTTFAPCDLDDDGTSELFLQLLNASEGYNRASIYTLLADGVSVTAGCQLDCNVKSVNTLNVSVLKGGKQAIYIDEAKGTGSVTEVLYIENGELQNPLLDPVTLENTSTVRYSQLTARDITGDGVPEIPISASLPTTTSDGERAYYTNWCGFDGSSLSVAQVTIVNVNDGYYLNIPPKTVGGIAVERLAENGGRTFYSYSESDDTPSKKLFTLYTVKSSDYEKFKNTKKGLFLLKSTESTKYVAIIHSENESMALTKKELISAFNLID